MESKLTFVSGVKSQLDVELLGWAEVGFGVEGLFGGDEEGEAGGDRHDSAGGVVGWLFGGEASRPTSAQTNSKRSIIQGFLLDLRF